MIGSEVARRWASWVLPEHRSESESYSEQMLDEALSRARGITADPRALAAVELAAGMIGRAFATATPNPVDTRSAALTPETLARIGRALVLRGEWLGVIVVNDAGVMLLPASSWDVHGAADPNTWRYRVNLPAPSGTYTVLREAAAVVHVRINSPEETPWIGVSPIRKAGLSATLAAQVERTLGGESKIQSARLAPLPSGDRDDRERFAKRLAAGGIVSTQTAVSHHLSPGGQEPSSRWAPQVIRADPAASMVKLRSEAARDVLAAAGIPAELATSATSGTASREAWRRFLHGTVAPLGRQVSGELAAKLDMPELRLDFSELHASDLAGRARAFQSMISAGLELAAAAALAGLVVPDDDVLG